MGDGYNTGQHMQHSKLKKQKPFDLTFLYSYISLVVLLLNNPKFNDYIEVNYPKEFRQYKDTTDVPKWEQNSFTKRNVKQPGNGHSQITDFFVM